MIILVALLIAASPAALDKSCKAGKAAACRELADVYDLARGVKANPDRSASLWKRSCKLGDQDGCADDALALVLGTGQYADPVPALALLEKLCKQGRQLACANLGTAFSQGFGTEKDAARAAGLLSGACDKKVLSACRNLAGVLLKKPELASAAKVADRGCAGGDPESCVVLGDVYQSSNDTLRAAVAFARGCDLGAPAGCYGQGVILIRSGADKVKGKELLDKACTGSLTQACIDELKPDLDPGPDRPTIAVAEVPMPALAALVLLASSTVRAEDLFAPGTMICTCTPAPAAATAAGEVAVPAGPAEEVVASPWYSGHWGLYTGATSLMLFGGSFAAHLRANDPAFPTASSRWSAASTAMLVGGSVLAGVSASLLVLRF